MTQLLVGADRFKRLDTIKSGKSVVMMIYGAAKTGKTYFMGTAGSRTLFINNGAGMETFKSPLFTQKVGANPLIVTINEAIDDNGLPVAAKAFDEMADSITFALENFSEEFDTICIDDSTAARRHAMYKGLEINQKLGKSKTLKEVVEKFDVVSAAVQDYGMEMSIILQFLVWLIEEAKKHEKHLIVGAHERHTFAKGEKIGDSPTIKRIRPGFTGQTMPDDIGGLWDILAHSEVVGGGSNLIYRLRFSGDEIIQAGSRYGGIFETVESNCNFLEMVKRIEEAKLNPKAVRR